MSWLLLSWGSMLIALRLETRFRETQVDSVRSSWLWVIEQLPADAMLVMRLDINFTLAEAPGTIFVPALGCWSPPDARYTDQARYTDIFYWVPASRFANFSAALHAMERRHDMHLITRSLGRDVRPIWRVPMHANPQHLANPYYTIVGRDAASSGSSNWARYQQHVCDGLSNRSWHLGEVALDHKRSLHQGTDRGRGLRRAGESARYMPRWVSDTQRNNKVCVCVCRAPAHAEGAAGGWLY
jgi:hypothetical protein